MALYSLTGSAFLYGLSNIRKFYSHPDEDYAVARSSIFRWLLIEDTIFSVDSTSDRKLQSLFGSYPWKTITGFHEFPTSAFIIATLRPAL